MAQNYKVYFSNRPVFFTQSGTPGIVESPGTVVISSLGKTDTMLIESAINRGARAVYVMCQDVKESWKTFQSQFEFVQAAGGLVINPNHEILFIFRHEKWDLPKGKVEKGESLEEGALREVEEECSISPLKLKSKLCTTWHTYIQDREPMLKATEWYLMKYSGEQKPSPQLIEGITDVRWLRADELAIVEANTYPSVLDVIEAYLKR
ncbi:MAG: NUDIX domain-containing protein [Flavobacteriales bacterium]|nr:NUDIX domain-containing protein [Flavobacteriales bacterium]